MKDNTRKYMLLTGKYLPEEDIESKDSLLFFKQYNEQRQVVYAETSTGYWFKKVYNKQGELIYYENSSKLR